MRYGTGVQHKRGGQAHIVLSKSKGSAFSYCRKFFNGSNSHLVSSLDLDGPQVRSTCKREELRERRSRKPGWWAPATE